MMMIVLWVIAAILALLAWRVIAGEQRFNEFWGRVWSGFSVLSQSSAYRFALMASASWGAFIAWLWVDGSDRHTSSQVYLGGYLDHVEAWSLFIGPLVAVLVVMFISALRR